MDSVEVTSQQLSVTPQEAEGHHRMAAAGIDASKLSFVLQYFDTTYIRTPPGMLKIAQLVSTSLDCVIVVDWRVTANDEKTHEIL